MSAFTYIRFWCGTPCFNVTTHRRYGGEETPTAKLECTEHGGQDRVVDWVDVALRQAHERKP